MARVLGAALVCGLGIVGTFGVATVGARSAARSIDPVPAGYEKQGRLWVRPATGGQQQMKGHGTEGYVRRGRLWVRQEAASGNEGGPGPSISLDKTVGVDPSVCAATDPIGVPAGSLVVYCYAVTNTGGVTLSLHDLVDDQLGNILVGFPFDLGPGASAFLTQSTNVGSTDVTNTAVWTAFEPQGTSATDSDTATVTILLPSIALTKTVGTDPSSCAATDEISVVEGTLVVYCYNVQNTGEVTLSLHDLVDDQLGTILLGFAFDLVPSAGAFLTQSTVIGSSSVTNTATWTAYNSPPTLGADSAESTDTAIVNVVPVPVELQTFDVN